MTDLTPEVQAAIEDVLALHQRAIATGGEDICSYDLERWPCRHVAKLSALLPPPEPTVEVTDEMADDLFEILWNGEHYREQYYREWAQRLANSRLCPAAWLPADGRVTELREAASQYLDAYHPRLAARRLRAALQAFDDTEDERRHLSLTHTTESCQWCSAPDVYPTPDTGVVTADSSATGSPPPGSRLLDTDTSGGGTSLRTGLVGQVSPDRPVLPPRNQDEPPPALDERYKELREAAADLLAVVKGYISPEFHARIRAALQAFDDTEAER